MATQFLKVELAPGARDFEQAALEPGIPLLDRTGAHYRTLKKWLGRLIAEPEWRGTEVLFYVSDDKGARPHDIRCEAASVSDRTGVRGLKEDMESIKKKLQEAKPDAKEVKLHQTLVQHFNAAVNPANPKQSEFHFFRYQDHGTWRLVWCWGYQRKDVVPAAATICTNPTCRQLFLRRQDGSRDCPACASTAVAPIRGKRRVWPLVAALLLAVVAGGVGYFARDLLFPPGPPGPARGDNSLAVSPAEWTGPSGSQLAYKVVRNADGKEEDVTAQTVAVSENPKIVRVERGSARIRARSSGTTSVVFYLGDKETKATVTVKPPQNPASIKLEPAEVALGIGSTARLSVQGDMGGGQWVDLTDAAEWQPIGSSAVSCLGGKLEGLAEGEATVVVRYRATEKDPYREAKAKVSVVKEKYTKLEIGVSPTPFKEGADAALAITLHTGDDKKKYSALGSSQLDLTVDPPGVAAVEGEFLRGLRAGKGKLAGKFGELSATAEFVVEHDTSKRFEVAPKELKLMVGELAELQVAGAGSAATRLASSDPKIVATSAGLKVVGRAAGKAELTVVQGAFEKKVEVEVVPANFKSIAFSPPRISVPIDRAVPIHVTAQTKDGEQIELAPEAIDWARVPAADLVELDDKKLELLGRLPTEDSPETMVARVGALEASGQVDVVPGPMQIELTPTETVQLPEGQTTRLHAFAKYGGGTRAEIDANRLEWKLSPATDQGIQFDLLTATVRARKTDAQLRVKAIYQGYTSNEVEIRSITQDLALTLNADRSIVLVGDTGVLTAGVQGAPLELGLVDAAFESSDPQLLVVDPATGEFRAVAAGQVKVTAKHPNAKDAATLDLEIVPAADAKLVIRPDNVKLLVNGRQPLELVLVAGDKEESIPFAGGEFSAAVAIGQPDAVDWQPPILAGIKEQKSFEITAEHAGKTARATVEVVKGTGDIRVVPASAKLSLGQALSPRVEQQVEGDLWQEIDPEVIKWDVPDALGWTAARGGLRPQLIPSEPSGEKLKLVAEYADKKAELEVEIVGDVPPRGPLAVEREPGGEDLPEGSTQRIRIVVDDNGTKASAVGVNWQPAFENEYLKWDPPLLTAKRAGHEQILTASVGDEEISFPTRTVDALTTEPELALPSEKPEEVRVVADQPQPIILPVGARFSSFHVESLLAKDRPAANVTRESLLQVVASGDPPAPISVIGGQVVCERPGEAELAAEFNGVKSTQNLRFKVVEEVEFASLATEPSSVRLAVGERVTLRVQGFSGDQSNPLDVGDITALPSLTWQSDKPEIVAGDGPTLTGLGVGQAKVTVTAGKATATIDVEVLPADTAAADELVVRPAALQLRVGESKWLGTDITVHRGGADVTEQAEASSSSPDIARYNPDLRFVEGILPGRAVLDLNVNGQTVSLPVEVSPTTAIEGGRIVVEPASGKLAVGESLSLRIWAVGDDGQMIDRTGSAVLKTSDGKILAAAGTKITGIAAGEASVTASLLGLGEAEAKFTVEVKKATAIRIVPSTIKLSVGERKALKVEAAGPDGRIQLGSHPDLSLTVTGRDTGAVDLQGLEIRGVSPGKATLQASWQGVQSKPVQVEVTDDPITGLQIEPSTARIVVGDEEAFRVYTVRGKSKQLVTAADNLEISVSDTSVASVNADQSVRGLSPGSTTVTAQLGSQSATARLNVVKEGAGGIVTGGSSLNGRRPRRGGGGGGVARPRRGGGGTRGGLPGYGPGYGPGGNSPVELPPGLQFIPDVLTLQLGLPGAPVRLVNVARNGAVEDVLPLAKLEVSPEEGKNVVGLDFTAAGPVFVPKKVGEAEIRARVGNRVTDSPLRVVVVDPSQPTPGAAAARLVVRPDPLRLNVGQSGRLGRVEYMPSVGPPHEVPYTVTSKDEKIVTADKDGTLHGMAAGNTLLTVRPTDPSLGDLKTDVAVYVDPPAPLSAAGSRLVLSGPKRITLGAPAEFRVELTDGKNSQNVTNDGARLALDADQNLSALILPGCILVPAKAGQLSLKALYKDLTSSNTLTITVDPPATEFKRLEIEVDNRPLVIDERRPYRLWGYPAGDAPRQDLTHLVDVPMGPEIRIKGANDDPGIAEHLGGTLAGRKAGQFAVQAKHGGVTSDAVKLEVVAAPLADARLIAEPAAITIAVGEKTPPLRVLAQAVGERSPRAVSAGWSSASSAIAEADPVNPSVFIGKSAGRTRLQATFNGQTVTVDLTVTGQSILSVVPKKGSLEPVGANKYTVVALVRASSDAPLEYRIVTAGGSETGNWTVAPVGADKEFELVTPAFRQGEPGVRYNFEIEARNKDMQVIARYPFSFRMRTEVTGEP
jgi:hypothetical protein